MRRRSFLGGLLTLAAPAIIGTPGLLMPIKPLLIAASPTMEEIVRRMFAADTEFWAGERICESWDGRRMEVKAGVPTLLLDRGEGRPLYYPVGIQPKQPGIGWVAGPEDDGADETNHGLSREALARAEDAIWAQRASWRASGDPRYLGLHAEARKLALDLLDKPA